MSAREEGVEEGVMVVHRAELPHWVHPQLEAFGPGHLLFAERELLWLRLEDGARAERPRGPRQRVDTAWRSGLYQHQPFVSVKTERWADRLDGQVLRAQDTGRGLLLDVARGAEEVRSLWWVHEEQVLRLADPVPGEVRIESLGEGLGLWVDPRAATAELLAPRERRAWRVALPSSLASGIGGGWDTVAYRNLWAVPELGLVVFACRSAMAWMELAAVRAWARLPEVRWRTVVHHPLAEPSAHPGGHGEDEARSVIEPRTLGAPPA